MWPLKTIDFIAMFTRGYLGTLKKCFTATSTKTWLLCAESSKNGRKVEVSEEKYDNLPRSDLVGGLEMFGTFFILPYIGNSHPN